MIWTAIDIIVTCALFDFGSLMSLEHESQQRKKTKITLLTNHFRSIDFLDRPEKFPGLKIWILKKKNARSRGNRHKRNGQPGLKEMMQESTVSKRVENWIFWNRTELHFEVFRDSFYKIVLNVYAILARVNLRLRKVWFKEIFLHPLWKYADRGWARRNYSANRLFCEQCQEIIHPVWVIRIDH